MRAESESCVRGLAGTVVHIFSPVSVGSFFDGFGCIPPGHWGPQGITRVADSLSRGVPKRTPSNEVTGAGGIVRERLPKSSEAQCNISLYHCSCGS